MTSPKPWWLEELSFAGQEHLDPAYIAGYDRKSGVDSIDDVALLHAILIAEAHERRFSALGAGGEHHAV